MPRPRLPANSTLPPRVQAVTGKRGGVRYYYRAAGGRKIALGSDPNTMRVKWAEIENGGRSQPGTFKAAWHAYRKAHFPKIAPRTRKDYESWPNSLRISRIARFRSIRRAGKSL